MPDNDNELLSEFAEFMKQKQEAASAANNDEDEEIEIWGPDGSGARVRRSRAMPFLERLGIAPAPEPASSDDSGSQPANDGDKSKPKGRQSQSIPATGSVARKYFVKK